MAGCPGCTCSSVARPVGGTKLLLSTEVSHTLTAVRRALNDMGARQTQLAPGVTEVSAPDLNGAMFAVRSGLSSIEAAEVRVLFADSSTASDMLADALRATSLAQACARATHADLVPLLEDETNSFHSVYQPIVSLADPGVPLGYEALLRAEGSDGPLMPGPMFAAAAAAGWLHVLDRIGRTTALRDAGAWLGDALLFVNFLPTTIYRPEVCLKTTEQAAHRAGLRLEQLVFEVTESEQITDLDHLANVFTYYRERGCKVALDDLGAGYSSLNLLVRLQPDIVKLDKDIVQALPDAVSTAVVSAVVQIVHAYGGQVLAEGVETVEQAAVARQLGVDLGQGWYFGRPTAPTAMPSQANVPQQARHETAVGIVTTTM